MVYIWLPLGYHVLPFSNYFVCTCFFMDVYHMIVIYLEIYTHEKCYIANWYPISLVSTSFMFFWIFWWLRKIFTLWVLALFYWILCTHFCRLCVLKWHALLLAYHSFETMVMLNAHLWCTLIKGFAMSHTSFGWA